MDMETSSSMFLVFTNNQNTSLYSASWTPTTSGQYAGTCIFLIILGIISRLLVAFKAAMERKWLAIALNRRYVVVSGKKQEIDSSNIDPDSADTALLTTHGAQENVKVVRRISHGPQPWRFSVDLPRALLFLCITGVNYLL